jgi:hypothetical protein
MITEDELRAIQYLVEKGFMLLGDKKPIKH